MGYDRFIEWEDNSKRPSIEELEVYLRRYINCSGKVEREGVWLYAVLPGEPCHVFRPESDEGEWKHGGCKNGERWFEMFCSPDCTYSVITRHADELTNAVADGWAALVTRYWGGQWNREA